VQVLEGDQSINHPHKILGGVQARDFLRYLLSPTGGILDVDLQRKQDDKAGSLRKKSSESESGPDECSKPLGPKKVV
jgi:hypothetical protein